MKKWKENKKKLKLVWIIKFIYRSRHNENVKKTLGFITYRGMVVIVIVYP